MRATRRRNPPTVVCAWCGKHLKGPRPRAGEAVSHGICEPCKEAWFESATKVRPNPELLILNPRNSRRALEGLYERFHFTEPSEVVEVPDDAVPERPKALMVIGRLESLVYRVPDDSEKDGVLFEHEFSDEGDGVAETEDVFDGSRPLLCADAEGRLHIVGGDYRVESRGIVG
jgi:hypothetical protein